LNETSHIFHHGRQDGAPLPLPEGPSGSGIGSLFGGLAPSASPLYTHGARFCDKGVANACRAKIAPDQTLSIDNLVQEFGDLWPEACWKMFNVVYQYGDRPMEVWVGR
jgi:hypothetical protein